MRWGWSRPQGQAAPAPSPQRPAYPAPAPTPSQHPCPGLELSQETSLVSSLVPLITRKPSLGRGLGPPPTLCWEQEVGTSQGSKSPACAHFNSSSSPRGPTSLERGAASQTPDQPQVQRVPWGHGWGRAGQPCSQTPPGPMGQLGTRPPSAWPHEPAVCPAWIRRPLQPLLLRHRGPRDRLSLPELRPLPSGPLPISVLGPPSLRTSCQDLCVFSELGHPYIII